MPDRPHVFVCSFSPAADNGGNGGFEWRWTLEQAQAEMRDWVDRYAGLHNLSLTILTLPDDVNVADGEAVTAWIDSNLHLVEPVGDFGGEREARHNELVQALRDLVEYEEEADAFPTSDEHPLYAARALLHRCGVTTAGAKLDVGVSGMPEPRAQESS